MRALVISGGGNKGAFAGGIADYLIRGINNNYDMLLGTSTGSLLIPLLSVGKVEEIKEVFSTVDQHKIFNSNPFKIFKDKNGFYQTKINHTNIARMFLKGKKTLGESENLRKLIKGSFSLNDFENLKRSGKKVVVTVSNISRKTIEYKNSENCNYLDFCDWVWASANLVPFMSLLHKNGCDYADGGFGIFIPIKKAIEMGAEEIDAIILRTQEVPIKIVKSDNALELFLNSFSFMINQIAINNIDRSKYVGKEKKIKINYYYIPNELTENVLIFRPEQMAKWWEQGYDYASSHDPFILDSRRKFFDFFN